MTAKFTASSDGSQVLIGNAAEDALEIDATAKTVKVLSPYALILDEIESSSGVSAISVQPNGELIFPAQEQSLASDGYINLPGGLIIQWGSGVTAPASGVAVTFPIEFPVACLSFQATPISAVPQTLAPQCNQLDPSAIYVWISNGAGVQIGSAFSWLAIGY